MSERIVGLDIGGANLKAATPTGAARTVPFALWKHPDGLPAALAGLLAGFGDFTALAVTMTGELCDCFETKREGVDRILTAVEAVGRSHPVHVWGTDGRFRGPNAARADWLKVAAANWHALATVAAGYVPTGAGLLIDVGSTTADVVPLQDGAPYRGCHKSDPKRLAELELVYTGVRRTPLCAVLPPGQVAAELFATTLDAYLLTGHIAPDPADADTADGRPATAGHAHARVSRMLGGDPEVTPRADTLFLARGVMSAQQELIRRAVQFQSDRLRPAGRRHRPLTVITSGTGEFLARLVVDLMHDVTAVISLADRLGPEVAACAPAFAVARLRAERPA